MAQISPFIPLSLYVPISALISLRYRGHSTKVIFLRKGGEDEANVGTCQKVLLVKEQDLARVKARFTKVLSEHIYSVQKSSENVTLTSMFLADKSMPGHDFTAAAALTSIKHSDAVSR